MPALTLIASTGLGALCFVWAIARLLLGKSSNDLINEGADGDWPHVPTEARRAKFATGFKTEGGEQPGPATNFAKHQLEGLSNKPLGSGL